MLFQNRNKQDCFRVPQQPSRSRLSPFNYTIEAATPTLLDQEGLASVSGANIKDSNPVAINYDEMATKHWRKMLLNEGTKHSSSELFCSPDIHLVL